MIYYEIRNSDDFIIRKKNMPATFDTGNISHKFGGGFYSRIIPEITLPNPIYDTGTQYLGGYQKTVTSSGVILERGVKNYDQTHFDNQIELEQIKTTALNLKNGVGTPLERLERCELVLFKLLKDQYGTGNA